ISLAAAGRDPARYANQETFDITRADTSHLAFGHGIHHCLGARLARLEGVIALTTLHGRFPSMRLAVRGPRRAGATATGWYCAACPSCRSSSARKGTATTPVIASPGDPGRLAHLPPGQAPGDRTRRPGRPFRPSHMGLGL